MDVDVDRYSIEYEFRHQLQTQSFGANVKFTLRIDKKLQVVNGQMRPEIIEADRQSFLADPSQWQEVPQYSNQDFPSVMIEASDRDAGEANSAA